MNKIDEVLTFAEAETIYGLAQGTLRKYLHQTPKEKQRIKEGIDYRKSGKVWIVTRESMEKIYSKNKVKMNKTIKMEGNNGGNN